MSYQHVLLASSVGQLAQTLIVHVSRRDLVYFDPVKYISIGGYMQGIGWDHGQLTEWYINLFHQKNAGVML